MPTPRQPRVRVNPDKYELKHIKRPVVQGGLVSTVVVDSDHYIDLGFSYTLVQRAGRILPRGIGKHLPAFMSLKFDIHSETYKMYVQYVEKARQGESFLLLEFTERPKWLKFMKPLPGTVQPQQQPRKRRKDDKDNSTDATPGTALPSAHGSIRNPDPEG